MKYIEAKMEVLAFTAEDVIATSGNGLADLVVEVDTSNMGVIH